MNKIINLNNSLIILKKECRKALFFLSDRVLPVVLVLGVVVCIWEYVYVTKLVSATVLPEPILVFTTFIDRLNLLIPALVVTGIESILGYSFGTLFGTILAISLFKVKVLEKSLLPFFITSQMIPILALAPMVIIWLGTGLLAKIVIVSYLTFFPMVVALLKSLQSMEKDKIDLLKTLTNKNYPAITKLYLPHLLPTILAISRVTAPVAIVGAILGELPLGSGDGLGIVLLNTQRYSLTNQLWAGVLATAILGITFYLIVVFLERFCIWQKQV